MMMIVEVPELFQLRRISEQGLSHLSDNVILLQYVQDGSRLARAITVLKTRAARHEPIAHRYEITERGLVLGDEIVLERWRAVAPPLAGFCERLAAGRQDRRPADESAPPKAACSAVAELSDAA